MSKHIWVTMNGKKQDIASWCRQLKISRGTIDQRMRRDGLSAKEAFKLGPPRIRFNLTGKTFGFLTVIKPAKPQRSVGQSKSTWLCRCKCGKFLRVWTQSLTQGNTTSCGCHGKGRRRSLGRTKEHTSWRAMMQRCYNPSDAHYYKYGGAGVEVYRVWHNFNQFLIDMGTAPGLNHSIDRYPNPHGNYTPGNTRWATPKQQANNKCPRKIDERTS